jgi:alkylation response protein AidB-like acyl-CoA dehydrogenase
MIDFSLTAEQEELLATVQRLMENHAPEEYLRRLDAESRYPFELYREWAEAGLLGLPFPEALGGQGGSVLDFTLVAETIGRWGYDVFAVYATPLFCGLNILHNGSPALRERWVPPLLAGESRFCVAMTEPDSGSDVGAMTTRAERRGDRFLITGEKIFATGAGVDDTTICLYARTDPAADHRRGITCFLVPNTVAGLEIRPVATLGRHLLPTTQLIFDEVEVSADNVLGEVDGGWDVLLSGLRLERLATSAAYVGNARTVVDEAVAYAKERNQFGRPIGDFQAMSHLLADMHTAVEAARFLMWHAAWAYDRGHDALIDISMAKLFGSEVFADVANKGMQVLGGYGYTYEFPMQRHFRTARAATITAGTSQMQRNLIAGKLGFRPG